MSRIPVKEKTDNATKTNRKLGFTRFPSLGTRRIFSCVWHRLHCVCHSWQALHAFASSYDSLVMFVGIRKKFLLYRINFNKLWLSLTARVFIISYFIRSSHIYILFAGREVRIEKNCARGLAYGPRPQAEGRAQDRGHSFSQYGPTKAGK